jgi:putative ABC transport system permease protein
MDTLVLDVRFALRQIWRRPGFSALVIIVLALGIGCTGAMFAVVRGVLFADLPFPKPDRLVAVFAPQPEIRRAPFSGPDFEDQRSGSTSFDALAAVSEISVNAVVGDQALRLWGARVSGDYFRVVGVDAAVGRVLSTADDDRGARVVVLSDEVYRQHFGSDPSVLGRAFVLDGEPFEIVGVLPPGHRYVGPWGQGDVWLPLGLTAPGADPIYTERGSHNFKVIGRLRPGVSVAQANADVKRVAAVLAETYPTTNTAVGAEVMDLKELLVENARSPLVMLLGAIVFVLLLTCVNAANLLLARASTRRGEIAMRSALGASRGRLVRQVLTESLVLAIFGGALGLLAALWALDLFVYVLSDVIPSTATVGLDAPTMLVTVGVTVTAGVLAGIVPALSSSRLEAYEELKESAARATAGIRRNRLRFALVVVEVSIAIALLSGAGLLLKSYAALTGVDPGFDPERVDTAMVTFPRSKATDPAGIARFQQAVVERLRSTKGVLSAATVDRLPQGNWNTNGDIVIEGQPPFGPGESPVVERRRATEDYFATMRIEMAAGRAFTAADGPDAAPVMIVNEAFARRFFPGEDPIGKRARWDTDRLPFAEIVGVIKDVKSNGPEQAVPLESFIPFAQHPDPYFAFVVKTAPGTNGTEILRDAIHAVDPMLAPTRVRSMGEVSARHTAGKRAIMVLLVAFAALAMLLAALGIYGVVAHQTTQRTREVGIRLALGAKPVDVVAMVVRQSMRVVGAGILVGLVLSLSGARVIDAFLFGTSALDPLVHASVAVAIALVGLASSAIPALRAAAVAPASALRYE